MLHACDVNMNTIHAYPLYITHAYMRTQTDTWTHRWTHAHRRARAHTDGHMHTQTDTCMHARMYAHYQNYLVYPGTTTDIKV